MISSIRELHAPVLRPHVLTRSWPQILTLTPCIICIPCQAPSTCPEIIFMDYNTIPSSQVSSSMICGSSVSLCANFRIYL